MIVAEIVTCGTTIARIAVLAISDEYTNKLLGSRVLVENLVNVLEHLHEVVASTRINLADAVLIFLVIGRFERLDIVVVKDGDEFVERLLLSSKIFVTDELGTNLEGLHGLTIHRAGDVKSLHEDLVFTGRDGPISAFANFLPSLLGDSGRVLNIVELVVNREVLDNTLKFVCDVGHFVIKKIDLVENDLIISGQVHTAFIAIVNQYKNT